MSWVLSTPASIGWRWEVSILPPELSGKVSPSLTSILTSLLLSTLCMLEGLSFSPHSLQCLASTLPVCHETASPGVQVPLGNLLPNSRAWLPVPRENC